MIYEGNAQNSQEKNEYFKALHTLLQWLPDFYGKQMGGFPRPELWHVLYIISNGLQI
jgi:hypothetical protein